MGKDELAQFYRDYLACLNARAWPELDRFVHRDVVHNGRALGRSGYRAMLEDDCRRIPDLAFGLDMMICDPPRIASRLAFDCTPSGDFLGLRVDGRRVRFSENVFYELAEGAIRAVWSIVDKAAIEAQLREP